MKAIKILSDIKLSSDNMSLELHPNCTLDDVYQGIEEINKIISFKDDLKHIINYTDYINIPIYFLDEQKRLNESIGKVIKLYKILESYTNEN